MLLSYKIISKRRKPNDSDVCEFCVNMSSYVNISLLSPQRPRSIFQLITSKHVSISNLVVQAITSIVGAASLY
jgi:hypothetical protein